MSPAFAAAQARYDAMEPPEFYADECEDDEPEYVTCGSCDGTTNEGMPAGWVCHCCNNTGKELAQ